MVNYLEGQFSKTCRNLCLDNRNGKHILRGIAQDQRGQWNDAEIDLDEYVANINGELKWRDPVTEEDENPDMGSSIDDFSGLEAMETLHVTDGNDDSNLEAVETLHVTDEPHLDTLAASFDEITLRKDIIDEHHLKGKSRSTLTGNAIESSLNLDECIQNCNGQLRPVPANGQFSRTCKYVCMRIRDGKHFLTASAQNRQGLWDESEINLDDYITNVNGELRWKPSVSDNNIDE